MNTATKEQLAAPDALDGWVAIRFNEIIRRTEFGPMETRWRWQKKTCHGKPMLTLLAPDGSRYQFKLTRGAWLRPLPPAHDCS